MAETEEIGDRRLAGTGEIGDKKLAYAAIALSIIGLIVLLIYAQSLKPKHVAIGSAAGEKEGSYLEVLGKVSAASSRGGNVYLNLCEQRDCIPIFVPGSLADGLHINPYLIKAGDRLAVRGTLTIYKGEPELVPLGAGGVELTG